MTHILSVASSYSVQPEEKLVTISRIKASSCPFRYFKEYIERPKCSKSFESIELGLGQFFHSYVENHFKRNLARNGLISKHDTLDIDDLITSFRLSFIWEGRLRKPYKIVRYTYSIEDFILRLEKIANNFNRFFVKKLVNRNIKAIEGELQIRTDLYYIRGKYDLITEDSNGLLVLWDWKTGQSPKPEYYEDFINQQIQLGIYAIWMKYIYNILNVKGTAVFLRDEVEILSQTFNSTILNDVLQYTNTWRQRINKLSTYPPILNNLCDWCGWNPVCPAYSDILASVNVSSENSNNGFSNTEFKKHTKKRCFIATTVFENVDAPEIILLRSFRDNYLLQTWQGRIAVYIYERVGPIVAYLIGKLNFTRSIIKRVILLFIETFIQKRFRNNHDDYESFDTPCKTNNA